MSINQNLENLVFETITTTALELYNTNPEYRAFEDKLFTHLEETPDRVKAEALKTALIELQDMLAETFYRKGLEDGQQVYNFIRIAG